VTTKANLIAKSMVQPTKEALDPLLRPAETVFLRDIAVEICRAFEFQIYNIRNLKVSLPFFMMPLGLAFSVLENEPVFTNWIDEMLASSRVTKGYTMNENAFGFGNIAIPRVAHYN